MDRKDTKLSMESKDGKAKQGTRLDRKISQSKFSEVGNMAAAKNKSHNLQLMKNLDHYDKQRLKAARSIEFAQRSFKDNLKTLNSKLGDVQFDDPRLRRYHGKKRRQSSPAPLSYIKSTNSPDVYTKGGLSPESDPEMPLSDEARRRFLLNTRLAYHRHSLPPDDHSSLTAFQTSKTNKTLSLKPDSVNIQSETYVKSASWSNFEETLNQARQNLGNSKSVSFSLPKIDSLETNDVTGKRKVTFSEHNVLPSIKNTDNSSAASSTYHHKDISVESLSNPKSPREKKDFSFRQRKEKESDPKNPVIDEEDEVPVILVSNDY